MSERLHLVYATDERYLLPTLVAVASAVFHASRRAELSVHILDCGIGEAAWERFRRHLAGLFGDAWTCERHVIDLSAYASFQDWHTSKAAYARLEICDILPEIPWCVWLDGDTLFVDDPFKIPAPTDPDDWVSGHIDFETPATDEWYSARELPWNPRSAICSGVMIMNLEAFRAHDIARKSLDFLKEYPDAPFADQSPINVLCEGHKRFLPEEWGVFSRQAFWGSRTGCIHYVAERPWEFRPYGLMGYFQTAKVWYDFARRRAKVDFREFPAYNAFRYRFARFCGAVMPWVFAFLRVCPPIQRRYASAIDRYRKRPVKS